MHTIHAIRMTLSRSELFSSPVALQLPNRCWLPDCPPWNSSGFTESDSPGNVIIPTDELSEG